MQYIHLSIALTVFSDKGLSQCKDKDKTRLKAGTQLLEMVIFGRQKALPCHSEARKFMFPIKYS